MEINVTKQGNTVVVSLTGRMDAISSPEFDREMDRLISEGNKNFILDFSLLEYISSAGLRSVLSASKRLKSEQGKLFLASLRDVVKEVFDISGFTKIIPFYDSVESALSNLK